MNKRSFHIMTFGCQMNLNDSLWLSRSLTKLGFSETGFDDAQIFILNTCSVREKPEQKVYSLLGRIRRATRNNPDIIVAVGGCVAQQIGQEFFKRFPQVRLVFGSDGIANAPQALVKLTENPSLHISLLDFCEQYPERDPALPSAGAPGTVPVSAFVNIMQGCDNYCAYCIVPYTRGRQKSRAASAIIQECKSLLANGARELTLLGQNVNAFGKDGQHSEISFHELLYQVAALPGIERLRFVTPHPKDLAPEVIRAFAELPQLCPRLHLPLQSGSDRILKRMGRKYNIAKYLDLVRALRAARPDIALSTDIIVGFPGETEEDFQATLWAMREADFATSFSFCYSDRPGTAATKFPDKIDEETKAERLSRLQNWQTKHTAEFLKGMVGRQTDILLESKSRMPSGKGFSWQGRDPWGFVVNVVLDDATSAEPVGLFLPVRITAAKKHSLFAEPSGELW